ncbi:unnamed protein product [Boreogadus saida]
MAGKLLRLVVLLVPGLLSTHLWTVRANRGGGGGGASLEEDGRDREGDAETPCEVKTVTVSTLPVLRENEFSFTGGGGGGSGSMVGGGGGGGTGAGGGGGGGESRLLLFVRTDLPGRISVMDDLDNTALPYFTLGRSSLLFKVLVVPSRYSELCKWAHCPHALLDVLGKRAPNLLP